MKISNAHAQSLGIAPKRARQSREPTECPSLIAAAFAVHGVPAPLCEYQFSAEREWRVDFAWPDSMLILEVEGGIWKGGRHTRGKGFLDDIAKYNSATLMGWRVFRVTPEEVESGAAAALIANAMGVAK